MTEKLPAVVQSPDCGVQFEVLEQYEVTYQGSISEALIRSAIQIDVKKASLVVQTNDFSFNGQQVPL